MRRNHLIALAIFFAAVIFVFSWKTAVQYRAQAEGIDMVSSFKDTTTQLSRRIKEAAAGLKSLPELEAENKQLKIDLEKVKITNQELPALTQENAELRRALGFQTKSPFHLIPARVISRESGTWWSSIQIDRGEKDGLESDMPVVVDQGLVGKTTTVSRSTSYVMLIADENCKVAATIEGTRESGILAGDRTGNGGMPNLTLNFLSKTAGPSLKQTQKIFSSGVGGVFPSGLFLGTIQSVEVRPLDARAQVIPAVDLTKLENVFVIVGDKEPTAPPIPSVPPSKH